MPDRTRSIANSDAAFLKARQVMPAACRRPCARSRPSADAAVHQGGAGCRVTDVDGNQYIDYVASYGPMIVGTRTSASSRRCPRPWAWHELRRADRSEIHLATVITSALPAVEMVRFVNSGTEATMSAIRLARAATGRDLIVKCIGCYHGHADGLLVQAGSGALTLARPVAGRPASTTLDALRPLQRPRRREGGVREVPGKIAAFCVEPVAGNMGLVAPAMDI
jgi:glutamate-1-semialdehyde 2,1-aminomutase